MAMVDNLGLPHLLFIVISNESFEFKWNDINNFEHVLSLMNEQLSWKDCPIECAHFFYTSMSAFWNNYIFYQNGILGCVKHHICQYEDQHTLFLHCHKILWICKNDVNKVLRV
jgi:hypothetical protein